MTDMQNSLIQEKSEVKSYKAQDLKKTQHHEIEKETVLTPSIKKETITIVKGIGQKVAEKLNAIGVHSVSDLAKSTPEKIARIQGIGLATAQKFIDLATERMRMKKLNDFPETSPHQEITKPSEELNETSASETESIQEGSPYEVIHNDTTEHEHSNIVDKYLDFMNIEYQDDMEAIEQLPEEVNEELLEEEDIEYENGIEEYEEEIILSEPKELTKTTDPMVPLQSPRTVVIPSEAVRQSTLAAQERSMGAPETLSQAQIKESVHHIAKSLKLSDFSIIEKLPELRSIFIGIDLVGLKHVRVKESVDLIYLIPIKICSLKGSLTVSSETVQYNSLNKSEEIHFHTKSIAQSYIKALSQVSSAIYSDLMNEGAVLTYLSRYLSTSISLEKSITRKNLFFRSGPFQYKILIEPVLVCQNAVGFTEKVIPFAYQKNSNIHIVEHSKLSHLLHFLDQKYFLIETYNEEKNAVMLDCEATNRFMNDLRKFSAPFMAYGIILLLVILSQAYSALPILINLGYGIAIIYGVMVSYLYIKLYKEKSALSDEFSTYYYQKNINFEDGTLYLISEELSEEMMEQFVFECVGKNRELIFLNKLETAHAERFLSEKIQHKKIEQSHIFEQDIPMDSINSEPFNSIKSPSQKEVPKVNMKDKYIDKYGPLLEE
ncbi:MAG: helix-hairpin-helix domain-containing protein [Candidatus Hodarchaeota archaeon]